MIVLDGVLVKLEWQHLKSALIDNIRGSAVLMTSRTIDHIAHCIDRTYELTPLSEIDSRKLFYRRIFGSEDKCPPELLAISGQLIKICGGVPLTIITMARFLENKVSNKKDEWNKFHASLHR